jgi:hypothetical protein
MLRTLVAAGALAAAASLLPTALAASGPAASGVAAHPPARHAVAAANFFVEWRIRPAAAGAGGGAGNGVVVTSNSATTGGSGFGPGAVVVGTANAGAPYGAEGGGVQGVRVANGKEAALRFDRVESNFVWDASWSARAQARAGVPPASAGGRGASASFEARSRESGAAGHEVLVHHVQGLRVTPWWTHGDALDLDLEITRAGDPGDPRDLDLHSTVRASIDEWLTVARLGPGDDELQIRVTWR